MAERVFLSPPLSKKAVEISSDSQDDVIPKRQKELVKLKYSKRRRRFRKKMEKTQASSSDSEPTVPRKSLELLSLNCDRQSLCSVRTYFHESTFLQQYEEATINEPGFSTSSSSKLVQLERNSFEKQIEQDLARVDDQTDIPLSTTKTRNTNWYSHLFGSIVDYFAGRIFSPPKEDSVVSNEEVQQDYQQDFDEDVEVMAERILQRVAQFCPQRFAAELRDNCILPLRHKLNQRGVTIGVCGRSQQAKEVLMKVIERMSSRNIGDVSYRLCCCPSIEDKSVNFLEPKMYFLSEQATCAAYVCVLSCGAEGSLDTLKWLLERDKDVITQGRLLLLANQGLSLCPPFSGYATSYTEFTNSAVAHCANPTVTHHTDPTVTRHTDSIVTHHTDPSVTQHTDPTVTHHHTNSDPSPVATSHSYNANTFAPMAFTTATCTSHLTTVTQSTSYTSSPLITDITHVHFPTALPMFPILRATPIDCAIESCHSEEDDTSAAAAAVRRVQLFVETAVGVSVPRASILLSPIDEDFGVERQQVFEHERERNCGETVPATDCDDDRVERLANEQHGIGQRLSQFTANCNKLRQLSITSDSLYCIEYCSGKLQCVLDDTNEEIAKLEKALVHKNHLMTEIKQLWTILEMRTKDSTLYQELSINYERDVKASIVASKECIINILERFQSFCVSKLEKLAMDDRQSESNWSVKDLCQLFKTDVERFACEAGRCLETIRSNLLFMNTHCALQQRYSSFEELHTLRRLSEAYLSMDTSSDDNSDSANSSLHNTDTFVYPCGLETIGCDSQHSESVSASGTLYSIMLDSASRILKNREKMVKVDLKKLTRGFVNQCVQCFESDDTKAKCVQFHVELISNLIFKHLEVFRQECIPQFKNVNQQLEYSLLNAKREQSVAEMHLKHLINLKVYLELKKSFLSAYSDFSA